MSTIVTEAATTTEDPPAPFADTDAEGTVADPGIPEDSGQPAEVDPNTVIELPDGSTTTYGEYMNGTLRQRKFTQEMQRVADMRREAETGLQILNQLTVDPAGTLQTLKGYVEESLGVPITFGGGEADGSGMFDEAEEVNPLAQEVQALKSQLSAIQQTQSTATVQAEVARLQESDPALDVARLAQYVQETGLPLGQAYKIMKFDDQQALSQRRTEMAGQKRANANVVSNGSLGAASEQNDHKATFKGKSAHEVGLGVLQMLRAEGKIQPDA
jgi:hypothetical protein